MLFGHGSIPRFQTKAKSGPDDKILWKFHQPELRPFPMEIIHYQASFQWGCDVRSWSDLSRHIPSYPHCWFVGDIFPLVHYIPIISLQSLLYHHYIMIYHILISDDKWIQSLQMISDAYILTISSQSLLFTKRSRPSPRAPALHSAAPPSQQGQAPFCQRSWWPKAPAETFEPKKTVVELGVSIKEDTPIAGWLIIW